MEIRLAKLGVRQRRWAAAIVSVAALAGLGALFAGQWVPRASRLLASVRAFARATDAHDGHTAYDGHTHSHEHVGTSHDEANRLQLSAQARKNIGLATIRVALQPFQRTISVPAMVVERPGRSQIEVTAPLGGRVTRVYSIQGEAVVPGQPLFDLRLTHEELVAAQSHFLRTAEELDVVQREIERLRSVAIPGAIPGKTIREREYEKQKLEAVLGAQRQSLMLHGLTREQVSGILRKRQLLQGLTVVAPSHPQNEADARPGRPFHIQRMNVKPGQYVDAGDCLCVLADHHTLLIQGKAFEEDAMQLARTANEGWQLSAVLLAGGRARETVDGLSIFYLSDVVEPQSRAFHFYVQLPNEIVRDVRTDNGHRFVTWRFKPGQRMQLRIPVERWENRIVLPIEAVVEDGAETFVFEQHGDHFDRIPVHVEYRSQDSVVIARQESLIGSTLAVSGAYQMQLALKNQAGAGVDPHAGHRH